MANPVHYPLSGASHLGPRAAISIALIAMVLGSCSINLGSLTSSAEPGEPARSTSSINIASLSEVIKNSPNDPVAYNKRGSALAQAGKTDEALADFNKAISLDPNSYSWHGSPAGRCRWPTPRPGACALDRPTVLQPVPVATTLVAAELVPPHARRRADVAAEYPVRPRLRDRQLLFSRTPVNPRWSAAGSCRRDSGHRRRHRRARPSARTCALASKRRDTRHAAVSTAGPTHRR